MKDIRERDQYREQMNLKREQAAVDNANNQSKLEIERERLSNQRQIADTNLQIARENKTNMM